MRLKLEDETNLANIYESILVEGGDVASVVGGSPISNNLGNIDNYAKGDNRIPKVLGGIQTRRGNIKRKKKRKKSRKLA